MGIHEGIKRLRAENKRLQKQLKKEREARENEQAYPR